MCIFDLNCPFKSVNIHSVCSFELAERKHKKPSSLIFSNENTKYLLAICLYHHVLCLLLADGIRHYVFYIVRCVFIPSVEKKKKSATVRGTFRRKCVLLNSPHV